MSSLQPIVAITSDRCPSANVAAVAWELAQAGIEAQRSVALVDFDLTSPQLHRFLDRDRSPGLIDVVHRQQHFADVIDFRLTRTSRFVALTVGVDLPGASDDLVVQAKSTIDSLVDLAETVLLIAGPLTSSLARDVVARADSVIVVVDGNQHLGWPRGRPAEMAGIDTQVIGWVADRGSPLPDESPTDQPLPDEPVAAESALPEVDVRASIDDREFATASSVAAPEPTHEPATHRLEQLWQRSDDVAITMPEASPSPLVSDLALPDDATPTPRRFFGLLRRSHYLD